MLDVILYGVLIWYLGSVIAMYVLYNEGVAEVDRDSGVDHAWMKTAFKSLFWWVYVILFACGMVLGLFFLPHALVVKITQDRIREQ